MKLQLTLLQALSRESHIIFNWKLSLTIAILIQWILLFDKSGICSKTCNCPLLWYKIALSHHQQYYGFIPQYGVIALVLQTKPASCLEACDHTSISALRSFLSTQRSSYGTGKDVKSTQPITSDVVLFMVLISFVAPESVSDDDSSQFDAGSFVGGIFFCLLGIGLLWISCKIGYRLYTDRVQKDYHEL